MFQLLYVLVNPPFVEYKILYCQVWASCMAFCNWLKTLVQLAISSICHWLQYNLKNKEFNLKNQARDSDVKLSCCTLIHYKHRNVNK